ncbi:type II toxin-antitoxin system RelE/ParE family toxin [Candidatus Pacearchaeota archaeon]|nr:type II toxin-antitoxin system RelE/ParE family toxin [Candidatus Pacearchaeota archaeon]
MKYQIFYEKEALKELNKLETSISRRIIKKIDEMSRNSSSCDIKKLKASNDYRLRVGDYRILFLFDKDSIKILKIGHRQQIYN